MRVRNELDADFLSHLLGKGLSEPPATYFWYVSSNRLCIVVIQAGLLSEMTLFLNGLLAF
jgi:hypothetical protein